MSEGAENPKDAAGRAKLPLHLWPASATAYGSIGLLEGQLKYGRLNWRATEVAASVYVAAALRHINAWMEGEENSVEVIGDEMVELGPHLGNALACLAILVDAMTQGKLVDDRNYTQSQFAYSALATEMTKASVRLKKTYGERNPKHWDKRDELGPEPTAAPATATLTMGRSSMANAILP